MQPYARRRGRTDPNVIFQLYASGGVELYFFQSLTDDIVRLVFALLRGLDRGSFVQVPLVIDIQTLEGIGKTKDLVLRELWKLPVGSPSQSPGSLEGFARNDERNAYF